MELNPYKPPKIPEPNGLDENSLAHLEHCRELRLRTSRKRFQLWRMGAWTIAAGVAPCFLRLYLYDIQFTYETMWLDAAAIGLIGCGLLLCAFTPVLAKLLQNKNA